MVDAFKPDYVAPLVGYLASTSCESTGELFEVSGGWAAQVRWQRTGGVSHLSVLSSRRLALTPSHVFPVARVPQRPSAHAGGHHQGVEEDRKLQSVRLFSSMLYFTSSDTPHLSADDGRATYPTTTTDALQQIIENFDNKAASGSSSSASPDDPEDPQLVKDAKANVPAAEEYSYTERDVILYALGVGATEQELKYVYEQDEGFSVSQTQTPLTRNLARPKLTSVSSCCIRPSQPSE